MSACTHACIFGWLGARVYSVQFSDYVRYDDDEDGIEEGRPREGAAWTKRSRKRRCLLQLSDLRKR